MSSSTSRLVVAAFSVLFPLSASPAMSRDYLQIVGSSTVFPYTQAVAEEFSYTGRPPPVVESTGTGGGMKIFCRGVGLDTPDIVGASRAVKPSEIALCRKNGVDSISEALIGYDGLSIAVSRATPYKWNLTRTWLYQALAAKIPVNGRLVDNPNKSWRDISRTLPDTEIAVYGPPLTSGTRDAFVELAMIEGCKSLPWFKAKKKSLSKEDYKNFLEETCTSMRRDGRFIEAGENDNLIVRKLIVQPDALGIFGYSFLYENQNALEAVSLNGVLPDFATIASGAYPLSRPLYVYIKNAHRGIVPGLDEFLEEYVSEASIGPNGYLHERGLAALDADKRRKLRRDVLHGLPLTASRR